MAGASTCGCLHVSLMWQPKMLETKREQGRLTWSFTKGTYGYCGKAGDDDDHQCKRYEGSCEPGNHRLGAQRDSVNADMNCMGADMCLVGAGPKYGFPLLSNACAPQYHVNQITFTPTKMSKLMPPGF